MRSMEIESMKAKSIIGNDKLSFWSTIVNVIKSAIGPVVVTVPSVFYNTGYLASII